MLTRYAFSKDSIETFQAAHSVDLMLKEEQKALLADSGSSTLSIDQLDAAIQSLYPTLEAQVGFAASAPSHLPHISLTLFVVNDATWNLMRRRPTNQDRMLPMLTVPWFYWNPAAEGRSNPSGIVRKEADGVSFRVDSSGEHLVVRGQCGDFGGVVDGRIAHTSRGMRPIFLPGDVGSRPKVPLYELRDFGLSIEIGAPSRNESVLYPSPETSLDYTFSENPKVFFEHGLRLVTDGSYVMLKTSRSKESSLRGQVILLVGFHFSNLDTADVVEGHVWLRCVQLLLGGGTML